MAYELWALYDQEYIHKNFDAWEFKFVRKLTKAEADLIAAKLITAEAKIMLRQNSSRLRVFLMTQLAPKGSPKVLDIVIREVDDGGEE